MTMDLGGKQEKLLLFRKSATLHKQSIQTRKTGQDLQPFLKNAIEAYDSAY